MLEPYVVLDFTDQRGEVGPMMLGDLGAQVIRVELPGGTSARSTQPMVGAQSLTFVVLAWWEVFAPYTSKLHVNLGPMQNNN